MKSKHEILPDLNLSLTTGSAWQYPIIVSEVFSENNSSPSTYPPRTSTISIRKYFHTGLSYSHEFTYVKVDDLWPAISTLNFSPLEFRPKGIILKLIQFSFPLAPMKLMEFQLT